jgi:hypothetical protein
MSPVILALFVSLPGHAETVGGLHCGPFHEVGRFATKEITECSGLVVSRKNPGILWVHNDSGDRARLFAVKEDGSLRGIYHLDSANAVDWEDMARGPCTDPDSDCLYVGDIGDNRLERSQIQFYRIEEPSVPLLGPPARVTLQGTERFEGKYPDGPHDAETLLVDPATGTPYLVTKEPEGKSVVYRFPGKLAPGKVVTLEKVCTLPSRFSLTGGDVTQDGSMIILRDYFSAYGYPRPAKSEFSEALKASPYWVPLAAEDQGEALGVAPSGSDIYTASEGPAGPIHKAGCTTARVHRPAPVKKESRESSKEP